jgi:hypothetical protein
MREDDFRVATGVKRWPPVDLPKVPVGDAHAKGVDIRSKILESQVGKLLCRRSVSDDKNLFVAGHWGSSIIVQCGNNATAYAREAGIRGGSPQGHPFGHKSSRAAHSISDTKNRPQLSDDACSCAVWWHTAHELYLHSVAERRSRHPCRRRLLV